MVGQFLIIILAVIFLAGCATTRQPSEVSQLQIKVAQLERKVDEKDQEINDLKDQVNDLSNKSDSAAAHPESSEEGETKTTKPSTAAKGSSEDIIRVSASAKEVQRALKKAGYYDGVVDGKLGAKSQKAIAQFQKDHNLTSDGVVGQKTWNELKKSLE